MRHVARQILSIVLLAAALGASGLNGYSQALAVFEHARGGHSHDQDHGQHAAHVHVHGGEATADSAPSHDDGTPSAADKLCKHMHAHCCGATAVPPAECGLKFGDLPRHVVRSAASHLPPGEGASSLFRPPRASA